MRYASWLLLCCVVSACGDDDSPIDAKPDAAITTPDAGNKPADASTTPDAKTESSVPKPALPRPPKSGLPDELRPPK